MDENDFRNPYVKTYGLDRKSWPPEVFLAMLLHEMRNPIAIIGGWVGILSNEDAKEFHAAAIEKIAEKIAIIEELHNGLGEYLSEHPPKT